MSPDILLTPPLLASLLIAGFVIPWMLSRNTCKQKFIRIVMCSQSFLRSEHTPNRYKWNESVLYQFSFLIWKSLFYWIIERELSTFLFYLSVSFCSSFSEALSPFPPSMVRHLRSSCWSESGPLHPLLLASSLESSVLFWSSRDCHYAITWERRQKVEMFGPMRARRERDDQ